MSKKDKLSTASKEVATKNSRGKGFMSVILGIGLAFVIGSIIYSSTVIALGTDGRLPLILIAPQAVFAVLVIFTATIKMVGASLRN